MSKRSNSKLQASLQLSRINTACRKVQKNSSLRNSNRSLLGKNINFQPISHRRISHLQSSLEFSAEFSPFRQFSFNKSKLYDSVMYSSAIQKTRYQLDKSDCSKQQCFLKSLYIKKTQDLKSIKNPKHQKIFIDRLKDKVNDQQFVASQCDFGSGCIQQICNFILTTNIKKLVLNKNPIGDLGIKYLNQTIPTLQLTQISLISTNLNPKGCKSLLQALAKSDTLKSIDLSSFQGLNRNRLGKQSATAIQSLVKNPKSNLQSLSFENSYFSQQCLIGLCNGVTKNSQRKIIQLKNLNISKNDIKQNLMKLFVDKFKHVPLRSLNISYTKISDPDMDLFAQVLGTQYSRNSLSLHLKSLNVSHNNIRSFGIQAFSKELMNNQILEEINFNDNPLFQGQRFFNFKFLLLRNWAIKTLNMQNTLGGLDSVRSLMQGLQGNRSVQNLDISRNSLDSQSFCAIMSMLTKNRSLKKITMNMCNIADFYLTKIEMGNYNLLSQISMDNNFVNDKGCRVLLKILNKNPRILKLSLKKNCLSLKNNKQIQQALKNNKILSQKDEPDMTYYTYVEQMHNNQKNNLMITIQKLQNQENRQNLSKLVCDIVERQKQIQKKQSQINEEKRKIQNIQRLCKLNGIKLQNFDLNNDQNSKKDMFLTN